MTSLTRSAPASTLSLTTCTPSCLRLRCGHRPPVLQPAPQKDLGRSMDLGTEHGPHAYTVASHG